MAELCCPPVTDALLCPQIMSVLLFIEHSVEVAHGKASCKFSKSGYLRIGMSRDTEGRVGGVGSGPGHWSWQTSPAACPF